ncbi:restriction endonuclease subunit S [Serratia marcescens]|nr:restriction endonuclease subunit S [Serratia marcescens]
MAKYKAYPEYKDSGVEWLGKIPTHWICTQIKYGYDITLGKMLQKNKSSSKDELKPYLKAQNIQPTGIDLSVIDNMWFSPDEKNKLLLKNNDVLISEGGDVGRSAIWQGQLVECYIQNAINRARAIKGNSTYFLNYWMVYLKSADFINTLCNKATIAHYTAEKVEASPLLLPNSDEQLQISLFLDHETAKIDKLIEKQQQLIELLKEKRQAVISHAVTKGLNPDVPMKDSGVEWLGEVPEHWIVRRLKHTSTLQSGMPKGKDLTGKNSISVPMLRVANVQDGYLDLTEVNNINIEPCQLERYLLRDGDVLMNEGGDNDKLGRGAVWNAPINNCIHQNHVFAIRPFSIESEWLDILTRADYAKFHFYRVAKQSTNLASISSTNVKETPLLIPPRKERDEILKFVNFQLNKIKATQEFSIKQVALLQERRTALISAAVTGKIDVRDWVAPDMQDAEEPQETTA